MKIEGLSAEKSEQPPEALSEILLWYKQANHQIRRFGKIVEVARMNIYAVFFEQSDGELFVIEQLRYTQNRVPPSFNS